jgi:membrane-associated phospholipid phosphatase
VFAIALVVFILIAAEVVSSGPLTLLDTRINLWLHSHHSPGFIQFFLWVSKLHSNWSVTIVTGGIAIYLWMKRLRYWILILAVSVWGGVLLNVILKLLFARPRAHFDDPILTLPTFSFPSGHTMLATVFYGTLCVFAFSRTRSTTVRALVVSLSVFMIALVGFSRMYLGVHYLTDVVGATAEGAAWISLSLVFVNTMRRSRN